MNKSTRRVNKLQTAESTIREVEKSTRPNQHWHLFCLATTWWTLFFILGLPSNYFQTTPLWLIIVFGEIVPAVALGYFGWRRCARAPQHAWRRAMWIAFYMSVPLFAFDYLYLSVHQQRGWAFFETHWYLTAFYIIQWSLLPPALAERTHCRRKRQRDDKNGQFHLLLTYD